MPDGQRFSRRQFLTLAATGVGAWLISSCAPPPAAAAVPTLYPTGPAATPRPTDAPTATAVPTLQPTQPPAVPLPDTVAAGRVTAVDAFYVQSHNGRRTVNVDDWRLAVSGMVDQPLSLSFPEILNRRWREQMQTLECIGNQSGGNLIGNAVWRGVSFAAVLAEAGVQAGATHLFMYGADEYTTGISIEAALDDRSLLAYQMNGELLTPDHGKPLRVLLPDVYGQKQPKWLTAIQVTDRYQEGYWEAQNWSDEARVQVNTRIEAFSFGDSLVAGQSVPLYGVAFSDTAGIVAVDVSVDDGATWHPADLLPGDDGRVWTLWHWRWENPPPGEHAIVARALDGNGRQTALTGETGLLSGVFPDGTNLAHRIVVSVA